MSPHEHGPCSVRRGREIKTVLRSSRVLASMIFSTALATPARADQTSTATVPGGGPCAPIDSSCDGFDDDCDGEVDEDFVSSPTSCGFGACEGSGSTACVGGVVIDTCWVGGPL